MDLLIHVASTADLQWMFRLVILRSLFKTLQTTVIHCLLTSIYREVKTVKVTLFCGENNNRLTVAEEESEGTLVSRGQTAPFQGVGSLGVEKKPSAAGNVHPATDCAENNLKDRH